MKRRIVLLGPPASGKGTQAEMITAKYQIPSVSPGSMLREERQAGTELGIQADKLTRLGQLVPDAIVNSLVERWLENHDGSFVFDGYPRSTGQAEALDAALARKRMPLEAVLYFDADLAVLQSRVTSRIVCSRCRRNFSVGLHVRSFSESCPACGAVLERRGDDTLETLATRMEEFSAKTMPLVAFYSQRGVFYRLDANRPPNEVFSSVVGILEGA